MVLGAGGQLGGHLCAQLGKNAIPIARDALDFSAPNALAQFEALVAQHAPDAIMNAAAYTNVAAAEGDEENAIHCNATMPARIADVCAQQHIMFVHGSTDYVFDGEKGAPYTEEDATAPLNAYGRSKLAGEKAVLSMNPHAIILRYSWLYDSVGTGFFATIRKLAAKQPSLRIVADQIGTPTFAGDAASMSLALLCIKPAGGIYHVASTGHTSWHGFACHAIDGATSIEPILAQEYTASVPRPKDSRLATDKVAAFGIAIPHWRDGLARCKGVLHGN